MKLGIVTELQQRTGHVRRSPTGSATRLVPRCTTHRTAPLGGRTRDNRIGLPPH